VKRNINLYVFSESRREVRDGKTEKPTRLRVASPNYSKRVSGKPVIALRYRKSVMAVDTKKSGTADIFVSCILQGTFLLVEFMSEILPTI